MFWDAREDTGTDGFCRAKDGTQLKETLGGNAITAASYALAEAGAFVKEVELFDHLASAFWKDGVSIFFFRKFERLT